MRWCVPWVQAFDNSMDKSKVTPYALAASEALDTVINGGKKDDITCFVGVVYEP